jgi:glycosyltransferase involved in cell wall biosynthesis
MNFPYLYDNERWQSAGIRTLKKVVLFTDVDFWVGGAGHRMRISALIKYLSGRVQLTVIYIGDTPALAFASHAYNIKVINKQGIDDNHLIEILRQAVAAYQFDTAIIEFIHNSYCLACLPENVNRILDAHDIISERAASFAAYDYAGALFEIPADLEYELFDQYDHVVVLTSQDATKIGAVIGAEKAVVCPHPPANRSPNIRQQAKNLGFIASEYLPNYDALSFFLKECWPSVGNNPDINLLVFGNIRKWFFDNPPEERVEFRGFVPELEKIYEEVDIVINPVRFGAGLKIKNIEAMANGLPVVTTTHGAAGLEAAIDEALLVADNASEFASQLNLLIGDYSLRVKMGNKGYTLASTAFSPEACFDPLLKVI